MYHLLTDEQLNWLHGIMGTYDNVICITLHGSHLYGVNTENSDIDLKAVHVPTIKDLIMKTNTKPKLFKNKNLNIELEVIPLDSFIRSAQKCDTNVIDMLYCPTDLVMMRSKLWCQIRHKSKHLISKKMEGLFGYIKTQTKKYSHKIDRYEEMCSLLITMDCLSDNLKLNQTFLVKWIRDDCAFKYISFEEGTDHNYINICGKKHIVTREVGELKSWLSNEISHYGERTLKGSESNGDWKSLSHATRVLLQVKELLQTKNLVFPLKDKGLLLDVKIGKYTEKEVVDMIDDLFEEVNSIMLTSDIPENPSVDRMLDLAVEEIIEVN